MAIRSGLGGQVGFAKEDVPTDDYGTYTAPTAFIEISSESLQKVVNRVDGGGMAAGRLSRLASRRLETNTSGEGSFTMQVPNLGHFGILLENLMGTVSGPTQQGTTAAYLQTHTLTDNWDKSLTIQKGVPDIDNGTVQPFNLVGCKMKAAEFACGVDEDLQVTFEVDARQVQTTDVLAAASYPVGMAGYTFSQGAFKTGVNVAGVANTDGVRRASVRIERPMKTDRFVFNQGGLKTQPILNDYMNVNGTFDIDFMNTTDFVDRFLANDTFAVVWEFTGAEIESPHSFYIRLEIPACILDGGLPNLDGPEISQLSVPFVARSNGTDSVVTIKYMSTDTTL